MKKKALYTRIRVKLDFVVDFAEEFQMMPLSTDVLGACEAALRALVREADFDRYSMAIEGGARCSQTMLRRREEIPVMARDTLVSRKTHLVAPERKEKKKLLRAAEEAGLVDLKLIVEGESSATVFALVAQCDLSMLRENAARHAYATAKLMRRFGNGEARHAFHRAARAAWLISPEKSAEYKSLYNESRLRMGMVPLPRLGSEEQKVKGKRT